MYCYGIAGMSSRGCGKTMTPPCLTTVHPSNTPNTPTCVRTTSPFGPATRLSLNHIMCTVITII